MIAVASRSAARRAHLSARAGEPGILLVTHGGRFGQDPALVRLATCLADRVGEVGLAVLQGEPQPARCLDVMSARTIHVVPLLMASGEVGCQRLRSALPGSGSGRLLVHRPIGEDPAMLRLISAQIADLTRRSERAHKETAVILVGHGNPRNDIGAKMLHRVEAYLRKKAVAAEVHGAFLRQAPFVNDWYHLTALPEVLIVPCFLSNGLHVRHDIPRLIRNTRSTRASDVRGRQVRMAPSLSSRWPDLARLILDRVAGQVTETEIAAW